MTTSEEFRALIESPESARVEFKAASGGVSILTNWSSTASRSPTKEEAKLSSA